MKDITDYLVDMINERYKIDVFYIDNDGNLTNYVFNAIDVYKTDTDDLSITNGNINDLEDLMLGNVRFIGRDNLFIDIPLRNIYMFNDREYIKHVNILDMHGFSPININHIEVSYMSEMDSLFEEIITISKDYFKMNSQDKFNSIKRINDINNNYINNL